MLRDCSFDWADRSACRRGYGAGHFSGARNRLFHHSLASDGGFKPAVQLQAEFDAVRGGRAPQELVSHCGSSLTACHNLLALEIAGLGGAALYPGFRSEWVAQADAPVATGPVPPPPETISNTTTKETP